MTTLQISCRLLAFLRALALSLSILPVVPVLAEGPMTSGGLHLGAISVAGEADSWTFSASAGSGVMLRVGATNFPPRLRVFDASNALVGEATSGSLNTRDVALNLVATNGGNYTVLASSANASVGTYGLHLAVAAPGEFIVPPGDEGGALQSGASNAAALSLGDLDLWSFSASAGDAVMLRMGGAFTPWIRLYNPAGVLVAEAVSGNLNTRDVVLTATATHSGTYLVVTSSTVASGVGAYALHLAHVPSPVVVSPGDQGGALANGARNSAEITLGDLDVWSFTAGAGDQFSLRMGGAFTPWIRVHGPNGILVANAQSGNLNTRDLALTATATNAGTYTVIASSTVASGIGAYDLHLSRVPGDFVVSPGDEGGPLVNGVLNSATISLGDQDMWHFPANAGDELMVRMGGAFTPWIRLYGPDGALVGEANSGSLNTRDVVLTAQAADTGTYVVVASSSVASGTGAYDLTLAQAPGDFLVSTGDQGGELSSGALQEGTITLGDLDLWRFDAAAGDGVILRMAGTFTPWIRLYGPDGRLVANALSGNLNTRDLALTTVATNAGSYTVVASSTVSGSTGDYDLRLALGRGPLTISPGDEGGPLVNGATNLAVLNLGDLDAWSFTGTVGDSNVFRVVATNFAPWVRLYGPTGTLVGESVPANLNTRSATLIHELTNNPGVYTVVVQSGVSGQSGSYSFKQSRWAPDLVVPTDVAVDEGETINLSIAAQDPDEPAKPLQFELLSAPPGVVFAIASATNATLSWPTSEATGPVTNVVVARVTDVVNGRTFRRTNSFAMVVREINVAPQLTVPADLVIHELTPLNASASATDVDLPANPLTFSLLSPPPGMTIDPGTGAIAWTPTEAQGPSTNLVTVVVTDDSPHAANERNLSTTNTFTVVVREVNTPPSLQLPPTQTVNELTPLVVTVTSTDADLPPNSRTFSLLSPPPGMTIDAGTGAIAWTPTEAQGPATNVVAIVVTDSSPLAVNATQLSVTNHLTVIVREVNLAPQLTVPSASSADELTAITLTASATDPDSPTNLLTFSLVSPPSGMTIDPATGLIRWTPTEEQGPSTNRVTVVVTDSNPTAVNAPALSTTNQFTLVVREVNTAPSLPEPSGRTIVEGSLLSVANAATDADLPANALTYTLVNAPSNAVINASGVITWTPTEAQGPGTNIFTTVVTDSGNPSLSATNSFMVIVTETNSAPVIEAIGPQSVRFGTPFTLQIFASDSDLPANTLTYAKLEGPANLTVNAQGMISWTPLQADVGSHPVTVRVTDDGSPVREATVTFSLQVTGNETRLEIAQLPTGLMQITIHGNVGVRYVLEWTPDLADWEVEFEFRLNASPFLYIDPNSQSQSPRFYRLKEAP